MSYAFSYPDFHIIRHEDELLEGRWYASHITWQVLGQYMSSYDSSQGRIHRFTDDEEYGNSILERGVVDVTHQLTNDESDDENFCCCLFSRKRHYT